MSRLTKTERVALDSLKLEDVKPVLEELGIKADINDDNYIEMLAGCIKAKLVEITYNPMVNKL